MAMHRLWRRLALFALVTGAAAAASADVTLEQALAARLRHPAELEATERLATARHQLARSAGILLDGATLSAAAGPRRSDAPEGEERTTDFAVGLDLPLLFARAEQRALAEAIAEAERPLLDAARAEAELEVELAFLEAWRDAEESALRESELGLVDDWLAATRRRVEAGAEPPYAATIAAGEGQRVALELDRARARATSSRARLEALAPIPAGALRLDGSDGVATPATGTRESGGAARLAPTRAAELDAAVAALENSGEAARWSLASEVAIEGDEELARFGLAYRVPPRGTRRSTADELAARQAAIRRRAELEVAEIDARLAAASRLLASPPPTVAEDALRAAYEALTLRVAEGKERPTAVLPERRALVDAGLALLENRHARAAAAAEIRQLSRRSEP